MTDLIPLDAAIAAVDAELKRYGFGVSGGRCDQMFVVLNAIPTINPAAIREAALREALDAVSLAAWKHCGDDSHSIGLDTGARVQNEADRDAILALIGEKK